MVFIVAGLLLLWLSSNMLRQFLRANPAALARRMKQGGGFVMLIVALLMLVRGQVDLAIGFGGLGFWLTSGRRAPHWRDLLRPRAKPASGKRSEVRSRWIGMWLDHATGAMSGQVLAGPFAGRALDGLDEADSRALFGLCVAQDPDGARLLEAYLDRRFARWRETDQAQGDTGRSDGPQGRRSRPGGMTENEAYQLLGLAQGASREEVTRAHRLLMKKFHPDHGGSTDVAARVNEAKDVLMRRHP